MKKNDDLALVEPIENKILLVREQRVINVATHDKAIRSLFDAIRKLMSYPEKPRRKIGFDIGRSKKD